MRSRKSFELQREYLGPILWKAIYNDVLRLPLPRAVKIVGFADDIILVLYDELMEKVELTAVHSVSIVEEGMRFRKLGLAHRKTEVVEVNIHQAEQRALI